MLIAIAIVFGGLILFNLGKKLLISYIFAHYEPPAVSVSSVEVKSINWHPYISAVGNFQAINGIDVNAQASGNVTKIHFRSGQFVEQGSHLIDLDDSVEQASLKYSQAELALQQSDYKRQNQLIKSNSTSSSSVDNARAKLLQAEAKLEKIQASINHKHITAPFSGMLGVRQVSLGQYIKPGETGIISLQSMDPIYLKFYLSEQLLANLHINQIITFAVEQNPSLVFKSKITAINSKSDANTRTVEVRATLDNCPSDELRHPDKSNLVKTKYLKTQEKTLVMCNTKLNILNHILKYDFLPGMFAEIKVYQPLLKNVIIVPSTAISYTMYGDSVFIIEKDSLTTDKTGKEIYRVKRVFVTTGDEQGNYTVIKSGLKQGQLIVATGELKLQDGTRVTINNSTKLPDTKQFNTLGQ